jgi:hypothetical protein
MYGYFHSSMMPTYANGGAGFNYVRWVNPQADAALVIAAATADLNLRKAEYQSVCEYIADDLPHIYLYQRPDIFLTQDNIKGFQVHPGSFETWNAADWNLPVRIYSVTPENAIIPVAGQVIQIEGINFTTGMRAFLGSYELLDVSYVSDRQLTALVPDTIPPGTYDLRLVSVVDGRSATLLEAFTVLSDLPPVVVAVNPKSSLNDTPVNIQIYGANFSPNTSASLSDGTSAIPVEGLLFISSSKLRGTVPAGIPVGVYDLVISDLGGDDTLEGAYSSLNPASSDDLFMLDETDLWSDPPSIQAGDTITLGLTVRRQGGAAELPGVDVAFYQDEPITDNLIDIGTSGAIAINGTAVATVSWTPEESGYQTLYAAVDYSDNNPENNLISRTVRVLSPDIPPVLPTVDSFTIDDGAPDTGARQVYLNVSGSGGDLPDMTPAHLLFIEYEYIQSQHDWVPTAISEWLPYDDVSVDYAWKLQPAPGVHYLQVWAADENGLISLEPLESFINYLPANAYVAKGQVYIYRYDLTPGDELLGRLTSLAGDADLYAWDPAENFIEPTDDTKPVEVVTVTATLEGIYQLEVEGYESANFLLEVNPSPQLGANVMDVFDPDMPVIRGRGRPLTVALPDDDIGLPETPRKWIFLPLVMR